MQGYKMASDQVIFSCTASYQYMLSIQKGLDFQNKVIIRNSYQEQYAPGHSL